MNKFFAVLLFVLLFVTSAYGQGISFNSNDKLISNRTSYNVFAHKQPNLAGTFSVEFDFLIRQKETFGYIFTINDIDEQDVLSLIYVYNDSIPELRFNLDGKKNLFTIKLSNTEVELKSRIKCSILFDIKDKKIVLKVNNQQFETAYNVLNPIQKPKLTFGKTNHSVDVPAFSLYDLKIKSKKNNIYFFFNESEGNIVYDAKGEIFGHVDNPIWLINDSFHWKLKQVLHYDDVAAISFNKDEQQLIFTTKDSIGFFNLFTEVFKQVPSVNKLPVPMRLGMSIVDKKQRRLFVYELNDIANNNPTIASLHLDSLKWTSHTTKQFDQQRHHHNSWFDSTKNRLYIFGGFGNYKFTNSIDYFDVESNEWQHQSFNGVIITPRFFSGMLQYNENEIIIFGGVGNESGDQSLGKEYYKDCYKINLSTNVITELWKFDTHPDFVSSRNMIISEDSSSFYTFNYKEYIPNSYLQLYNYSIEDGIAKAYGDSISIISERIRTNANLYLNKSTNELFCVLQEFELSGANVIKIYSINFPPVTANQLTVINSKSRSAYFYVLIVVLLLVFAIYIFYTRNLRKRKVYQKEISDLNTYSVNNVKEIYKNNSISLFGNFKVIDLRGKDISYLFSPKIKQLLLILLLKTEEETGITSEYIYNVLWPDKERANAKNIKNVTLNQLRKILSDLDGIEIIFDRASFRLITTNSVSIDFWDFRYYLNNFNDNPEESLNFLHTIICKGSFLKEIDLEHFDKEKQLLEDRLISTLENVLDEYYKSNSHSNVILATNILLSVDPVNETAIVFKACTYKKLKMLDEAKKAYNSFLVEYAKAYKENFSKTFSEILSQEPGKSL
ncbi:Kelch motif-containing protein [Saccharicrinis carchari]|uniref:Kelch motif-containing protein n=1 Tax=Saccharicrinis carchari TaxID=1168039 RepID=A0A521F080_SACCC|nr:kelch repeat-containing protein [Saccharicrinis carchari]SMO89476.1 Kelch motif-containing protein [Saccharicrinis carchari]